MSQFTDYVVEQTAEYNKKHKKEPLTEKKWLLKLTKGFPKCLKATNVGKITNPNVSKDVCIYFKPEVYTDTLLHQDICPCDIVTPAIYMASAKLLQIIGSPEDYTIPENKVDDISSDLSSFGFTEEETDDFIEFVNNTPFAEVPDKTSTKLKQVFFPLYQEDRQEPEYYNLSIIPNASLMFSLKNKISKMKAEKRENIKAGLPYKYIYGLTETMLGSGYPQNVSLLALMNGGKSYLLSSIPPTFKERKIRYPKKDFIYEAIPHKEFQDTMYRFHKVLKNPRNNKKVRDYRNDLFDQYLEVILTYVYKLRETPGWTRDKRFKELPYDQKVLLDDRFEEQRDDDWKERIAAYLMNSYFMIYESMLGHKRVSLCHGERVFIKDYLEERLGEIL